MRLQIGKNKYSNVQVQKTPEEHARGMQGRVWGNNDAMYFDMQSRYHSFHTTNCIIPMDIVFVNAGRVVKVYANCPPNSMENYVGFGDVVVELPANTVFTDKITIGNKVTLWQSRDNS